MKSQFYPLALLIVSLIAWPVLRMTGQTCSENCVTYTATGEDDLELVEYFKTVAQVEDEYNKFSLCVKHMTTAAGPTLNVVNEPLEIKICAIVNLFHQVFGDVYNANLTGLEVHLGLESGRMVYIFQPLYMKYPDKQGLFGDDYKYTVIQRGSYYGYDPSTNLFSTSYSTAAQAGDLKSVYRGQIRILPVGTTGAENEFIPVNEEPDSWQQDTKSIIFSFQEIFELIDSHNTCVGGTSTNYQGSVFLYSGIIPKTHLWYTKNKHTVFIAKNHLSALLKNMRDNPFNVNEYVLGWAAANVAHLCPPSCNPVYTVKSFNENGKR